MGFDIGAKIVYDTQAKNYPDYDCPKCEHSILSASHECSTKTENLPI